MDSMNVTATLLAQMFTFALLVLFIMKFLWVPLTRMMEDRKNRIAEGLAAADKGKHDEELAKKRAVEILREAKDRASELISKAEARAGGIVEEAKQEAKQEAERIMVAARAEIDREADQAKDKLRDQLAGLVVAGAEKILHKEISAKEHDRLLNQLAKNL
jgi:F-type H+-transporting ATPase subunit b